MSIEWYELKPEDTLVIKKASPSEMGESHTSQSIFPPPVSTLSGAFRTAVLVENRIPFPDYTGGKADTHPLIQAIGKAGEAAPFQIIGPFFKKDGTYYVPAPYNWFADKKEMKEQELAQKQEEQEKKVRIFKSKSLQSPLLKSNAGQTLQIAKGDSSDLVSIGGKWLPLTALFSTKKDEKVPVLEADAFFSTEPRTGNALTPDRRVRESHLYTFTHFRLHHNVQIVCGTTNELPLPANGKLELGAEKRTVYYQKITGPTIATKQSEHGCHLSLSPVMRTKESNNAILATGKPQFVGGWDMKRKFHKPMRGFFPAGSVFSTNINQNCIAL